MTLKERYRQCIEFFRATNPNPATELNYSSDFELLVAVILSAQCTDKRVNLTTPSLFAKYPDAREMAKAEPEEIAEIIKSVSFANNKSRYLASMARILVHTYQGEVPHSWEAIAALPGVGRKTANVVSNELWGHGAIGVDTHVFRVAQRFGLVPPSKTPAQVENALMKHVPAKYLGVFHHWLLLHGRYICIARKPKCSECGLRDACRYFQSTPRLPPQAQG